MSSDSEQYLEFIEKLQSEDFRPAALNDLRKLLVFKPASEAATLIEAGGISKIVQCLNANDESQVDLTYKVLKLCFEKFTLGDVVRKYTGHVMYLLRHEKDCVRKLALDEIYKTVTSDPALLPVPQYIDVFVAVAQLVSDKDISIANKSILITSNLPFEAYLKVLEEMKIALEYDSSSKCNAYEVIINISSKSYELLKLCADQGYIEFMLSELQSSDILYRLTILELLSRLAIKTYGIAYLVKTRVLQKVAELVEDVHNIPLSGLLTPGYMKFFGSIAHHYPKEIFEKYPVLLDCLFDAFESADHMVLPVALDTLGFIGTTIEGKLCLAALGSKYTQIVQTIGQLIKDSTTDIKIRALYCFASLISVNNDPKASTIGPVDHRVTLMTREWFRSLSTQPGSMETLFEICKNPFPDIRLAAFALLDAICQHQWGEELVASTAGFIEYLLDRTVDYTQEAKEAKYDVIKKLSRSAAFDSSILNRIQTYVEQGPFYSETLMQVAMEEGD